MEGPFNFRQTFFFQNEAQKVLYKPVLVWDLISHRGLGGVIASQTSEKLYNQQNQISPSIPQLYKQKQIKNIWSFSYPASGKPQGLIVTY